MNRNRYIIYRQPGYLIRRAHQICASIFIEETRHGITPIQFAVMQALVESPGLDQVTLASRVCTDTATCALLIRRLEGKGYVNRAPCPEDRRRKRLVVTDDGRRVVAALYKGVAETQKRILAPLAVTERKQFMRLLTKLVEANNELSRAPMKA